MYLLLFFTQKLTISDSITTVNIRYFQRFVNDFKEFKDSFSKNFNKIFSAIILVGTSASYFAPTLIRILVGAISMIRQYPYCSDGLQSYFTLVNIINSSVLIPAKWRKV